MRLVYNILHIFSGFLNLAKFRFSTSYRKKQENLFNKRLSICESCDYVNFSSRQCNECGCFIDVKTKVIYKLDEEGYSISYIDPNNKDIYYACPKKYW